MILVSPFLIFWGLIWFARHDLGWRGIAFCVAIWGGLFATFMYADLSPHLFIAAQALLDCILILVIFKGDIHIR